MTSLNSFVLLALLLSVAAVQDTPVAEVITLLEDLQSSIQEEGTGEATTYNTFACFCRDTTATKSTSITEGQDNIDTLSADIEEKTASKTEKETELQTRKGTEQQLQAELAAATAQYRKDQAEYEATAADLTKAISSVQSALTSLKDAKPPTLEALVALKKKIMSFLAMGEVFRIADSSKKQAVSALLQQKNGVDPSDPEYKFHSQPIIDLLEKLLTDFQDQKETADSEFAKTKATYDSFSADKQSEISTNNDAIGNLETGIEELKSGIAEARQNLVSAEDMLKDDQTYLKDLTERCEARAKDWDQRSSMRADELTAISQALTILKDEVQGADAMVNQRALMQVKHSKLPEAKRAPRAALTVIKPVSFLQSAQQGSPKIARSFLAKTSAASMQEQRKDHALNVLGQTGKRLNSAVLVSLTMRMKDDPFVKVKQLIQNLIERLLAEATAEASKKGFCDTELGKAIKDRDFRQADVEKLATEIGGLQVKVEELEAEIEQLSFDIVDVTHSLGNATEFRAEEKEANMATVKQAKEGLEAVTKAILVLKKFYKQAAKAASLIQASPVDEDTAGAGFQGSYKGKQDSATGVIGLLEVIQADFERTVRTTQDEEKKAARNFVEFERTSKADLSGKTTLHELDTQELESTKNKIAQKMADLQTAQNLVDKALEEIEALKPMCLDTGMSFAERSAKREEEIAALKQALCILDEDKVEPECQ